MVKGSSIDYDVVGEGHPLLLISGLGFGRWSWFKQVPALSERFRTISFDLRNVGRLSAENGAYSVTNLAAHAVALLEHLEIERAHVVGTSLGGFVAQELALRRPDLVDRLVLISTSYGGSESEPMSVATLGRMLGWGATDRQNAVRRGLEVAVSEDYPASRSEEFDRMVDWRVADSPPLSEYTKQFVAGARFDASGSIEEIRTPTLVLHGSEDRVVPVPNAVSLAERLPDAELRVLEDAGHLVFVERAEATNREILEFLKTGPSPAPDMLSERLHRPLRALREWAESRWRKIKRRVEKHRFFALRRNRRNGNG
jgi:pimeloyl-ACP methyl ester carboxylesterase